MREHASIVSETSGRSAASTAPLGLHRLAQATAAFAFFVLFAGGMVTSTGSGLAVPDWPLSFHRFFPPMVGGVFFEHGHRLVAGTVALLIWSLAIGVFRKERRGWVRVVAAAAAFGVVLQALLGGLTVLLKLPPPVSIAHACLGQTVFCLVLTVAQATSPWYIESAALEPAGPWRPGALAVAAVFLQLLWGAIVRHTGLGLGLHMAWAAAVVLTVGYAAYVGLSGRGDRPELGGPSGLLTALLPLQLALGILAAAIKRSAALDLGFRTAAALVTLHLAVGALLLGTCVVWTLRARRLP